ncbi:MAG: hypothetical protein ACT4OE_06295 [Sphingosinicella sp.]
MTRPNNLALHPTAFTAGDKPTAEPVVSETTGSVEPLSPRRAVAKPAPPAPAPSTDLLDERLAEELATLRRYIESAHYLLGQDGAIRHRYAAELGNLDHVAKSLGELGLVIGAANKEDAVDRTRSQDLKARLQRKPLSAIFPSKH